MSACGALLTCVACAPDLQQLYFSCVPSVPLKARNLEYFALFVHHIVQVISTRKPKAEEWTEHLHCGVCGECLAQVSGYS